MRAMMAHVTAGLLAALLASLLGVLAPIPADAQSVSAVNSAASPQTAGPNQAIYQYKGPDRLQRLIERARQEGSVTIYTSLAPTEASPLVEAFEKKYGIKVLLWRGLSDGVVQRTVSEFRSRRHAVDVLETNGPEMEALARELVLDTFYSPMLADLPPAIIPRHGLWVPDRLNFFVVAYNPRRFKPEDFPKTYEGFLDSKWKGRVALEATDAEWMGGVVKHWGEARGMAFFNKLAEMKPDMRKGHILLAQLIASGEVDVGLTAYYANVASAKRRGSPLEWAPVEPVIARPQGIGLARHAPHPHAALLFAEFILSAEIQAMMSELGRVPASRAVKGEGGPSQYVMSDPAVVLDESAKWQGLWDKLFVNK
jgi:iron(III) transport system substrate-binding protein